MTIKQAAEKYEVKTGTLKKRVIRDFKKGNPLHGCKKMGRDWFITKAYMEAKYGEEKEK